MLLLCFPKSKTQFLHSCFSLTQCCNTKLLNLYFRSYDITQCLKEYEIDLTNYTYVKINEKLSIEEFRRVLEDNINKEVVHIDTTGNVEVGKNLVVDGKIIVNDASKIVDTSGNQVANKITLTLLDDGTYQLNIE